MAYEASEHEAVRLVKCLFQSGDYIDLRYIQRTANGERCRGDHATYEDFPGKLALLQTLNDDGCCMYYGVNPRKQPGARGNESVEHCRTLVSDLDPQDFGKADTDTVTEEEYRGRLAASGLPEPTLEADSGRGWHVAWRLTEPAAPDLWSHCQARLALAMKSDKSVADADQLLRLPGYINRKPKANGRACRLLSADPARRYHLSDILDKLPPLPRVEPKPRHLILDHLDPDHAKNCAWGQAALRGELDKMRSKPSGQRYPQVGRSAAALGEIVAGGCLDADDVTTQLTDVAIYDCGQGDKNVAAAIQWGLDRGTLSPRQCPGPSYLRNYVERQLPGEPPKSIKIGLAGDDITRQLARRSGGWPKRVDSQLFTREGDAPLYLDKSAGLFAWMGRQYRGDDGANRVQWIDGADKLPEGRFYAHLQQTAEPWRAVEAFPHAPSLDGHYYIHPTPQGGDGRALEKLLAKFSPATDVDAALIRCFFLSLFWGGPYGERPAWLITSPDDDTEAGRGVGKTTLAKVAASLCGGELMLPATQSLEEFQKRLFSPAARGKRLILIDNVKSRKFSWADLEAFITSDTVSGRALYTGEGRVPNTFTVAITVNGARLSKDMAQRCIPIIVKRPERDDRWHSDVKSHIERNRWAIIGDIIQTFRLRPDRLKASCRWATWEAEVLAYALNAAECQRVIAERQNVYDEDQGEAEDIRDEVARKLGAQVPRLDADSVAVLFPAKVMADVVREATGKAMNFRELAAYLSTLGLPELKAKRTGICNGYEWRGPKSDPTATRHMIAL